MRETKNEVLMRVVELSKKFSVKTGFLQKKSFYAVDDVSFSIMQGKIYGLVGESGCGKSTLCSNILLLDHPTSGTIYFKENVIDAKMKSAVKNFRKEVQMIFQDPYASIDPRMKIKDIVAEPMRTHKMYKTKEECYEKAKELLDACGMPQDCMERYPHEFSGGQRQRISIARVLAMNPKMIIADEATAALDVSVQAQILNLLKDLQEQRNLTMIFISHNLNIIKHISNYIIVMYMGAIVEMGDKDEIYNNPKHPYTRLLLSAVPNPDPLHKTEYIPVKGELPNHMNMPTGCPFQERCGDCMEICKRVNPNNIQLKPGNYVRCHLYDNNI